MPTPPVPTFSVNGHTYVDADFEQENMPATMSALANDIAAAAAGVALSGGYLSKAITGDTSLTTDEALNRVFNFSCSLSADAGIFFPSSFVGLALVINTNVSGAKNIRVSMVTGSTVTVAPGSTALVYSDGTNMFAAIGIVQTDSGAGVNGTLSVSGAATIGGALTVGGALDIGGSVTGTAFNFTGDGHVHGGFEVFGTSAFHGDINIEGDINADASFSANTLLAAAGATIAGSGRALQVAAASGEIRAGLSAPAGQASWMQYETTGFATWLTGKNTDAQSGGNVGANYDIVACDDAGTPLGIIIRCRRSDLALLLESAPTSDPGESRVVWIDSNGFVRASQ